MAGSTEKGTAGGTAAGAAIGGYYGGPQGAAAGGAIGGSVGSMFGGDPVKRQKRSMRASYHYQARYLPYVNSAVLDGRMNDFRKHGLHPLFALGGGVGSGGGSAMNMPGQSDSGSSLNDGFALLMQYLVEKDRREDRKEITQSQANAAAMRALEQKMNSDNATSQLAFEVARQKAKTLQGLQEFKPGEVKAHMPGRDEQSTDVERVAKAFQYGGQTVWLPVEDISDLSDNMIASGSWAFTYHGNRNVDWDRLWWYHKHGNYKGYRPKIERIRDLKIKRNYERQKSRYDKSNKRIQHLRNRAG